MGNKLFKCMIQEVCRNIIENKELLNSLDAKIGDGDHGTNMARGSQAILDKIEAFSEVPPGDALNQMAMTLISSVGGASGPLYGTALMKLGMTFKGHESIDEALLKKGFRGAVEGIKQRGKSDYGCKTMLDVLIPACDKFEEIYSGGNIKDTLETLSTVGREGIEYTVGIKATRGRASYLGERSIGTADPGATSSSIIIDSLLEAYLKSEDVI